MEINDEKQINALKKAKERWDIEYKNYDRSQITTDDWMDLFEDIILNCKTPIIDLGCGKGKDTLYLVEKGKTVIPCDYSISAVESIKKNFPEVERAECFDMTKEFPFEDNFTDLIICGLSLHYFTEKTTFEVLKEIKRVLKPGGILLFRVNSINDVNYGAGEGEEVEKNLYETSDGRYKRFFDQEDIDKFFADWEKIYAKEETIVYDKAVVSKENVEKSKADKVLWRCAVRVNK